MLANRRLLFPIFLLILVSFVIGLGLSTRANNNLETTSQRLSRHAPRTNVGRPVTRLTYL